MAGCHSVTRDSAVAVKAFLFSCIEIRVTLYLYDFRALFTNLHTYLLFHYMYTAVRRSGWWAAPMTSCDACSSSRRTWTVRYSSTLAILSLLRSL